MVIQASDHLTSLDLNMDALLLVCKDYPFEYQYTSFSDGTYAALRPNRILQHVLVPSISTGSYGRMVAHFTLEAGRISLHCIKVFHVRLPGV